MASKVYREFRINFFPCSSLFTVKKKENYKIIVIVSMKKNFL